MKRLNLVLLLVVIFLPSAVLADGKNKPKRKAVGCNSLKGKARARCEARAQAAAKRRAERAAAIARQRELAAQAIENRLRAESKANIEKDNTTGEDLTIRSIATTALGGKAGTVLVMNSQTGLIYTIVNQEWGIRKSFTPCSTIKLVTSVAGVDSDVIDEEGGINDPKFSLDLNQAIAKSNNLYFQKVGTKLGNEKFVTTAKTLGLGQKTGINADGENSGRLPLVKKTALQYSHGVGTEVTALQLGVLASEITNGGRKVVPTIPKDKTEIPKAVNIDVPQNTLQELIPGMSGTTEFGTARRSGGYSFKVAGKTGTCSDSISRVGLFTSVAPYDNPLYTVVVIIRGRRDQTNGPLAAFIAGRIYQSLDFGKAPIALVPDVKPTPAPISTPK